MAADEVSQVYIQYPTVERMPLKELKAFRRVHVEKNGEVVIQFRVPLQELQKWDLKQRKWVLYPGNYTILVGSSSEDIRLRSIINVKTGLK